MAFAIPVVTELLPWVLGAAVATYGANQAYKNLPFFGNSKPDDSLSPYDKLIKEEQDKKTVLGNYLKYGNINGNNRVTNLLDATRNNSVNLRDVQVGENYPNTVLSITGSRTKGYDVQENSKTASKPKKQKRNKNLPLASPAPNPKPTTPTATPAANPPTATPEPAPAPAPAANPPTATPAANPPTATPAPAANPPTTSESTSTEENTSTENTPSPELEPNNDKKLSEKVKNIIDKYKNKVSNISGKKVLKKTLKLGANTLVFTTGVDLAGNALNKAFNGSDLPYRKVVLALLEDAGKGVYEFGKSGLLKFAELYTDPSKLPELNDSTEMQLSIYAEPEVLKAQDNKAVEEKIDSIAINKAFDKFRLKTASE